MTTQAKHTPGPWNLEKDKYFPAGSVRITASKRFVCRIEGIATSQPEDQANARLIASAPQLLEALQAFLDAEGAMIGTEYGNELLAKALAQARAAIRDATKS